MRQTSLGAKNGRARLRGSWLDPVIRLLMALTGALFLSFCGDNGPGPEREGPAAEAPDGGSSRGGSPDAGNPDGGSPQGGSPDAGNPDGGGSAVRVDVNGRVMDLAGQVKDGTWVVIKSGSFRATPTVDSEGNFTVASVPIPYDVWVIVEGTSPWDYLRNATTAPMEVGVTASLGSDQSQSHAARFDQTCIPSTANLASISGRVSGGIGFPTPDALLDGSRLLLTDGQLRNALRRHHDSVQHDGCIRD